MTAMLRRLALALALALGGLPALAQTSPRVTEAGPAPTSIIWIGNSFFYFNNGITAHVGGLLRAARRPDVRASLVTISGSGFDWHDVESYFRPNAIGRYSFNPDNTIRFNTPERLFDMAVMMDCSQCPLHPDLKGPFDVYAKRHAETVRRHGARPVFFMSWAYEDKPEMTAGLAEAYTRIGNALDALVIPAGLAFARVQAERPEAGIYAPDRRHPSLAGTYLAAAVSYAAIFVASPVDLPYTAGLDPKLAGYLQQVAWRTVQDYYGRK
ncbi:hypothetical protein [Paracraurococcus lichenis]|uniref:SGNH/GDSL hydrolase family protein n=1 Tax=Paracraurococcus lichenis TaxID=3064888 RepID=A0ABT9DWT1_9PROT|nr:hypothetical protein [Paracraurococcus sp. LOR1-02]MDO9708354.1 hypothetical protein [Paracraurococcus sp. LOR1-02]